MKCIFGSCYLLFIVLLSFLLYVDECFTQVTKVARKWLDFIRNDACPRVLNFKFCCSFVDFNFSRSLKIFIFSSLSSLAFSVVFYPAYTRSVCKLFQSTFSILCHCPTPSAHCTGQRFFFSVLFLALKLQTLLQCPDIKVITERVKVKSIHCCLSFCSARSIQESNTQNFQLSLESRKRWVRSFVAVTRTISGHTYHACLARRWTKDAWALGTGLACSAACINYLICVWSNMF